MTHSPDVERPERRRSDEALAESTPHLHALFAGAAIGIAIADLDSRIIFVNPAYSAMTGYTETELLGRTFFSITHPDDLAENHRIVTAMLSGEIEHGVFTKRYVRKDGGVVWVQNSCSLIRDATGTPHAMSALIEDITNRKRAEETARLLAEAQRMISASLDFTLVAQRIALSLCRLLDAPHAVVGRVDPETGEVVYVATASDVAPVFEVDFRFPPGIGVCGLTVEERRPVITHDALADGRLRWTPEIRRRVEQSRYRALLDVPLIVQGRVIGVLGVGDDLGRVFNDEAVEIASAFADQAAVALQHARLFEEAQRRQSETELLAALAARMGGSLDLETVLQAVADGARNLVDCDHVLIRLRDPEQTETTMVKRYWSWRSQLSRGVERIEIGKGAGGLVLLTGQPFRTEDYQKDPRITKDYVTTAQELETVALIVVPIRLDNRIEGLIYAADPMPRHFTARDEASLLRLAGHAAIAIRNAELFKAEAEARQEAQLLSRKLVEVQETERAHLARELHDQVGQMLTALQLGVASVSASASAAIRERLGRAEEIVVELIRRVRGLSLDLRPSMLDDLGLVPTLIFHCDRFSAQTGVPVTFEHFGVDERRFAGGVETAVYRIVQEALTNVARHAGKTSATVRLTRDAACLTVQVEDDGVGFEPSEARDVGSGLAGMRERVRVLGGTLSIETVPGAGVKIRASFSLPRAAPATT